MRHCRTVSNIGALYIFSLTRLTTKTVSKFTIDMLQCTV